MKKILVLIVMCAVSLILTNTHVAYGVTQKQGHVSISDLKRLLKEAEDRFTPKKRYYKENLNVVGYVKMIGAGSFELCEHGDHPLGPCVQGEVWGHGEKQGVSDELVKQLEGENHKHVKIQGNIIMGVPAHFFAKNIVFLTSTSKASESVRITVSDIDSSYKKLLDKQLVIQGYAIDYKDLRGSASLLLCDHDPLSNNQARCIESMLMSLSSLPADVVGHLEETKERFKKSKTGKVEVIKKAVSVEVTGRLSRPSDGPNTYFLIKDVKVLNSSGIFRFCKGRRKSFVRSYTVIGIEVNKRDY